MSLEACVGRLERQNPRGTTNAEPHAMVWRATSVPMCVALAACGAIAPVPEDAGPRETFAHAVARTFCDNIRDCCIENKGAFDARACVPVAEARVQTAVVAARVNGFPFHDELVPECLHAVTTLVRTCDRDWAGYVALPVWAPECNKVFSRLGPLGAPCDVGGDCASGRCSRRVKQCGPFVPRDGDPCEYYWDCRAIGSLDAQPALRCDMASLTCTPLAGIGGPCADGTDCVAQATCRYSDNRCITRTPVGSECNPYNTSECTADAWCDPSRRCKPLQPNGSDCTAEEQCAEHVCDNLKCNGSYFATTEYCGVP